MTKMLSSKIYLNYQNSLFLTDFLIDIYGLIQFFNVFICMLFLIIYYDITELSKILVGAIHESPAIYIFSDNS